MGIPKFFEVFKGTGIGIKELAGKTIAIDASSELYRCSLGVAHVSALTDKNGDPTTYLYVIFNNIAKYLQNGITMIWVFDNPKANMHKKLEHDKRKKRKDNVKKVMEDNPDGNKLNSYEKQLFTINSKMINNLKKMLNFMKVAYIEAPENCEAEHIASNLTEMGIADMVQSLDADVLMYGGKKLLKKLNNKYTIYDLNDILAENNLDIDLLINVGLCLGTDFTKKISGIGTKTVLTKCRNIVLTEEMMIVKDEFKSKCKITDDDIIISDKADYDGLLTWLVEEKGFSHDLTKKKIISITEH